MPGSEEVAPVPYQQITPLGSGKTGISRRNKELEINECPNGPVAYFAFHGVHLEWEGLIQTSDRARGIQRWIDSSKM